MKTPTKTNDEDTNRKSESTTNGEQDPYVYVGGKKEMADGSGMVKESMEEEEDV